MLYHQALLLGMFFFAFQMPEKNYFRAIRAYISMKSYIYIHYPPTPSIRMQSLPKVKLGKIGFGSNIVKITQRASGLSYMVMKSL